MADRSTILIADSPPGMVPDLSHILREHEWSAVACTDALFVLTMALRHKPSAVVLGGRLTAGGALVALRRLRSSVHTASIPVVAVADVGASKQALLSAGADECLEAPATPDDVWAALQRRVERPAVVTGAPMAVIADSQRLAALTETELLDSAPDEAFDVLTRLAATVLTVPVALVSLVDDRGQFFKSQVGLPSPWAERRQTPLSHSFCQWVVSSQDELAITDARDHPVLRANRAVFDLGVIAYAGVPLSSVSGAPIGSFCAIDDRPRSWSEDDLATLRDLALIVDAHTALGVCQSSGSQSQPREFFVRTAGRGFLGAARLLRRGRPKLTDDQRRLLVGIIERFSHQLIDIAQPVPVLG